MKSENDQGDADAELADLFTCMRNGDQDATEAFVGAYRPHLLRLARWVLERKKLGRYLDATDLCQVVLFTFINGLRRGDIRATRQGELQALLDGMIRHEVANYSKRQNAVRRDVHRLSRKSVDEFDLLSPAGDPSLQAAADELFAMFLASMSKEDMAVFQAHMAGQSLEEIAATVGRKPGAVRMRLARMHERFASDLWLDS